MRKKRYSLLWFAPPIVVIVAFFASIPWLKELDDTAVLAITATASVFVLVWGRFVAMRMERSLDEVQLAGQRFAQAKGAAGGTLVTILLLLPKPLRDWVTDNLISLTSDLGTPDRDTVLVGMVFGVMLLSVMQALGTVVANAIWNRRLGGNA